MGFTESIGETPFWVKKPLCEAGVPSMSPLPFHHFGANTVSKERFAVGRSACCLSRRYDGEGYVGFPYLSTGTSFAEWQKELVPKKERKEKTPGQYVHINAQVLNILLSGNYGSPVIFALLARVARDEVSFHPRRFRFVPF